MIWLLYSISTAVFLALRDYQVKKYVSAMDPLTLSWSLYLFSIPIMLIPFIHFFSGPPWGTVIKHSMKLVIPSIYHVLTLTSLYAALALAHVAYVSSIRRLNVLISIFIGVYIFKEGNMKTKLIGGSIMVAGAVTISLAKV